MLHRPPQSSPAALSILCAALFVTACGGDDEVPAEPAPEESAGEERPSEPKAVAFEAPRQLPETPVPENTGLFVVTESDVVREIPRGERSWLERTNAERGFGFEQPRGAYLESGAQPLWVLRSSNMELSTLRLTRYTAEALLPPQGSWTSELEAGRFAWLPVGMVRLTAEVTREDAEVVRVRPQTPLTPGLYVLHDGATTRGRLTDDVSTYYPFQVLPEGFDAPESAADAAEVWLEQVMPCTRELEVQLAAQFRSGGGGGLERRIGPDRASFARAQGEWIRHCASQIAAVMSTSEVGAPAREKALAAIRTLQTVAQEPTWGEMQALLDATDPRFSTGALLYVWLELEALEIGHALLQALEDKDDVRVESLAPRLSAFHLDRLALRALSGASTSSVGRERMLWPPFFVDARWSRVDALSRAMATPLSAVGEAATLLLAYHTERLKQFDGRYGKSPLTPLVDDALQHIAPQVLVATEGLDPSRAPKGVVVQGRLQSVEGAVDPAMMRTIQDALRGSNPAFAQCVRSLVRRQPSQGQGVFAVLVELKPDFPTGTVTARLGAGDPRLETAPFGDADFNRCMTRSLPALGSYYGASVATLALPLAFNAGPQSAP